jgi:starch synthase
MADIAIDSLETILAEHPQVQFAALGSGDPDLERRYREFAARHPGRVGVVIGYDERTAHVLHAGSDMLLHGSRFEPFGLTPVYSMRYGTVPIASRVGGLIDTITDHGPGKTPAPGATGFLFDGDTPADMTAAIRQALLAFAQPRTWRKMQRDGMQGDHGWNASAEQYIDLYRSMTEGAGRGRFKVAAPIDVVVPQPASTSSQKKRA